MCRVTPVLNVLVQRELAIVAGLGPHDQLTNATFTVGLTGLARDLDLGLEAREAAKVVAEARTCTKRYGPIVLAQLRHMTFAATNADLPQLLQDLALNKKDSMD